MQNDQLQMRWLGIAGIELKLDRLCLLIDPFITRPPIQNVLFGKADPDQKRIADTVQAADLVLVTHAHYDHLMDVPLIARQTGAQVYGSANTCHLLQINQVPRQQIHRIQAEKKITVAGVRIQVLIARHANIPGYTSGPLKKNLHAPLRLRDYRMDSCFSFLIDIEKTRILVWSSTSVQNALPADILFVRAESSQGWYEQLLAAVRPSLVIPTHWDDLFKPLSSPGRPFFAPPAWKWPPIRKINLEEFKDKISRARPKCRILFPNALRTYCLNDEMEKKQ
jgi:L-ascorbate metabolism protein UlaG (beta-lactamase superfamily)